MSDFLAQHVVVSIWQPLGISEHSPLSERGIVSLVRALLAW